MCFLLSLFEFKPGQMPCWMVYDCGTAVRLRNPLIPSDKAPAAAVMKGKLFSEFPRPTHQPDGWAALGLAQDGSIHRIGKNTDIPNDKPE